MRFTVAIWFILFSITSLLAQDYNSWFTGDTSDVNTNTVASICLMGGATESDPAMVRFLEDSGGGDVVVIRASGSDGYNNYLFSELGVPVNSVHTIRFNNGNPANDPYVISQIENAEALWIAGGNQWNYVDYWKDTPIEDAINYLINVKGVPVGGTSAGMAILSGVYFSAENGTITSESALNSPNSALIALGNNDFIDIPLLSNYVTDTHYNNPDRRGRQFTFMARMAVDYGIESRGIGANEFCAVYIDEAGTATAYGEFPDYEDFVYFLAANCDGPNLPETLMTGSPLTWDHEGAAVKVYKMPATVNGDYSIYLPNHTDATGGNWENWWAEEGVLSTFTSGAIDCLTNIEELSNSIQLTPNPTTDIIRINSDLLFDVMIFDLHGNRVLKQKITRELDVSRLDAGIYFAEFNSNELTSRKKFIKID